MVWEEKKKIYLLFLFIQAVLYTLCSCLDCSVAVGKFKEDKSSGIHRRYMSDPREGISVISNWWGRISPSGTTFRVNLLGFVLIYQDKISRNLTLKKKCKLELVSKPDTIFQNMYEKGEGPRIGIFLMIYNNKLSCMKVFFTNSFSLYGYCI